jgi:hypothetical protein
MMTTGVRLSTVVTAPDVLNHCGDPASLADTVTWCRVHGIDKVYLETYRGKTQPDIEVIATARRAFERAGVEAAGSLCTTDLGQNSEGGWQGVPCFSRGTGSVERLEVLVRHAAPQFEELIIDNRLFTDCRCEACAARKGNRTWAAFRQDLMVQVCERHVLGPAFEVNPNLRLVFKFPSWYEGIALRGYDVLRHAEMFHSVCAGAETRDPTSEKWGKRQPYGAFFTSHWYHQATSNKCMGCWIDTIACSPAIFLSQARGSILGGARELVLFRLGHLRDTAPAPDSERHPGDAYMTPLCAEREQLDRLATLVAEHPPIGVAGYRDPGGDAGGEPYVFEYLGMLGIPIVASPHFPYDAPAAAVSEASVNVGLATSLGSYASAGKSAVVTSRVVRKVPELAKYGTIVDTSHHGFPDRMRVQESGDQDMPEFAQVLEAVPPALEEVRRSLLEAVALPLEAPPGVGVTLLGSRYVVVQNFRPETAGVRVASGEGRTVSLAPGGLTILERPF